MQRRLTMDGFKGLVASKTVWGVIISVLAMLGKSQGFVIGEELGWVNDIVSLVASIFAIYGRAVAVKKIGSAA